MKPARFATRSVLSLPLPHEVLQVFLCRNRLRRRSVQHRPRRLPLWRVAISRMGAWKRMGGLPLFPL